MFSGTWSTPVVTGEYEVGIQAKREASNVNADSRDGLTWTLMVFPDAIEGVPAIGTWGLVALTLLIVSVGSVLIRRRGVA